MAILAVACLAWLRADPRAADRPLSRPPRPERVSVEREVALQTERARLARRPARERSKPGAARRPVAPPQAPHAPVPSTAGQQGFALQAFAGVSDPEEVIRIAGALRRSGIDLSGPARRLRASASWRDRVRGILISLPSLSESGWLKAVRREPRSVARRLLVRVPPPGALGALRELARSDPAVSVRQAAQRSLSGLPRR